MRTLIPAFVCTVLPFDALAHGGEGHDAIGWTFDPIVIGPIGLTLLLYGWGFRRLAGQRKGFAGRHARSALLFLAGIFTLIMALVSPIHELGEHLFTVHMIEHELVMGVAAPLLVFARPGGLMLWSFSSRTRKAVAPLLGQGMMHRGWRWLTSPTVATTFHGLAIWIWHAPPLFDGSVESLALHRLQHVSFLVTAIFFWWAMVWRAGRGTAAWHLVITMMHTSLLGALIALSPRVLFVAQTRFAPEWGMTALEDQQFAGLLMWVPGGIVYAGAALWMLMIWISRSARGDLHADLA